MKRNVILSTVAATVVTGVLMMSGCSNGSKPVAKRVISDIDVPAVTVDIIAADDKLTFGDITATNPDAGNVVITGRDVTAKAGKDCSKEPCTMEFKRGCGKEEGKALNYINSCAVKNAFDAIDATGPAAAAGNEFRYAGFIDVSSDDIQSCKINLKANLDCSLDKDGQVATNATGATGAGGAGDTGPVLDSDFVYINSYTAPAGNPVAIYVVPNEGCSMGSTGEWYTGTVQYHDAEEKHAYVDVDGVDISDIPARVYFFVEEFSQVDGNDVQTGASSNP